MHESSDMEYSDINADFIIIQSCLSDDRHSELIKNFKNVCLLDDHLTFNLGDSFESYEALKLRLDAHSKHSNVHYWMRDTRTVAGARMRTTRRIEPRLKYYNIRYACVYGGHKHLSKSKGKRHSSTMKLDCPAHIALRANPTGERLNVVSVCNHHNHEISSDISQQLRQARRLSSQLKDEVLDLLRMGVVKRRVLDYVRYRSGKMLRYKDVINMAAAVKGSPWPAQPRRKHLIDSLKEVESEHGKLSPLIKDERKQSPETKKRRRKSPKKTEGCKNKLTNAIASNKIVKLELKEEPRSQVILQGVNEFVVNSALIEEPFANDVCREVEIQFEEENADSIAHSEIMEYLYRTEDEPVLTILNQKEHLVSIEPEEHARDISKIHDTTINSQVFLKSDEEEIITFHTGDLQLGGQPVTLLDEEEQITVEFDNTTCLSEEMVTLDNNDHSQYEQPVLAILNEELTTLEYDGSEQYLSHVIVENPHMKLDSFEDESAQNSKLISPEAMHILTDDEIILEEQWLPEDVTCVDNNDEGIVELQTGQEDRQIVEYKVDKCSNCEKIKFDLNAEVNSLKAEKDKLIEETKRLKSERDNLLQERKCLKEKEDVKIKPPMPFGVKPIKIRNKLYLVKI